MKTTCVFCTFSKPLFLCIYILLIVSSSHADDSLSVSGRLNVRGVSELNEDSVQEDPSVTGRLKLDAGGASWKLHSWFEGGWDGAMRRPTRDHSLFKSYDEVYQDNNPYLEIKELYIERSFVRVDLRAGIQRFAWGRMDEFPPNDLLNPWDYTQFLRRPLEDRKIGVPSVSASVNSADWTHQAVFVPWFVPYRLSKPGERWAGLPGIQTNGIEIVPQEPDLPTRTVENSSLGFRSLHQGDIEWAINLYHGNDPTPVFHSTALLITPLFIDPGYEPSYHKITSVGLDAAAVTGDWSIRAEAAYIKNRYYNIKRELWGYPVNPVFGLYPLNPIEVRSDALVYGVGADYRPFEDSQMTMQAQQTVIMDRPDTLYERKFETLLSAILRVWWMNQKIETGVSIVYNPEHDADMVKVDVHYTFTDSWKAGVAAISFNGPPESTLGRYSHNDQIEAEAVYAW